MKTVVKRLLTCAAAFSLLVTCTISGLVLPVAATEPAASEEPVNLLSGGDMETGTPITATKAEDEAAISYETVTGYDGNENNRVLAVDFSKAVSTDSGNPTVFLTYAGAPTRANGLEEGRRYLLSFKIKGVACQFWGSNQWTGVTGTADNIDASRWYGISAVIGATQEVFNAWHVIDKYNSYGVLYFDDFVLQELEDGGNLMPLANGDVWPLATGFNSMFEHGFAETEPSVGKGNLTIQTENDNRYYKITPKGYTSQFFPHVATWGEDMRVQRGIYQVSYRFRVHEKGTGTLLPDRVLDMTPDASHSVLLGRFYTPADANGWRTCVLWFALGTKEVAKNDVDGNATFYTFKDGSCDWVLRTTLDNGYDYDLDDLTLRAVGTAAEYSAANAGNLQSVRIAGSKTLSIPAGSSVLLETEGTLNNGASWIAGAHTGTLTPSPVVLESDTWATVEGETITRIPENAALDPNLYTVRSWITATATATWASSDEAVATVDAASGYVTMVSTNPNDSATITVTATINGVPVTDSVVVKPLLIAPTAIAMNDVTIYNKGNTAQMSVVATAPANAWVDVSKITWTSSDESVATVDENGVVTSTYGGEEVKTATITAVYEGIETPATAVVTVNNNLIGEDGFASITTDDTQNAYLDVDGGYNGKSALVLKVPAETNTYTNVSATFKLKTTLKAGRTYLVRAKMKGSAVGMYSAGFGWVKHDDKSATAGNEWAEVQYTKTFTADTDSLYITFYNVCRFTGWGFTGDDETNPSVDVDAYISDLQIFDLQVCDEVNILSGEGGILWGDTQKNFVGTDSIEVVDGETVTRIDAFSDNRRWNNVPVVTGKVYVMKYKYKPVDPEVGGAFTQKETGTHWTANAYKMGDATAAADENGWTQYVTYAVLSDRNPNTSYLYYANNQTGAVYVKDLVCYLVDKDVAPISGGDYVFSASWTTPYLSVSRFMQATSTTGFTWEFSNPGIMNPSNAAATGANFWCAPRGIGSTMVTVTNNDTGEQVTFKVVVNSALQPDGTYKAAADTPNAVVAVKNVSGANVDNIYGTTMHVQVTPNAGYLPVPGSLRYVLADGTEHKLLTRVETETNAESTGYEFILPVPEGNFTIKADMAPTTDNGYQIGTVGTSVHRNGSAEIDGVRFLTRMYVENLNLTGNTFTVKVDGTTKAIKSMGTLLKRASNAKELTLENVGGATAAEKVWQSECYNNTVNCLKVLDYTNSYIDFAAVMMTNTPSDAFRNRDYVTCGYIVFEDDSVIYTTPMTDSAAAAASRGA